MPYTVHWETPHGVVLALTGVVQSAEFKKAVHEVHSSPHYDQLRYVIDDLSAIEAFDVDAETIDDVFASSVGAGMVNPNRRIYLITNDQVVLANLARMTQRYAGGLPIELHASMADARKAIEVDLKNRSQTVRVHF